MIPKATPFSPVPGNLSPGIIVFANGITLILVLFTYLVLEDLGRQIRRTAEAPQSEVKVEG